jgi:phosphoenolpyruvate synthase/pyruvate phosphate dikinase
VDGTTTPNLAVVDTKHDVMTSLDIHQKDLYLSPDMIKEIAHILKWLEENFGCPVDVEFLVTRTNSNQLKFSIVQVRPITHLMADL